MFIGNALTQSLAVVDWSAPASQAAGTLNGAAVAMKWFNRLMYTLQIGSVGASGTVNATIQGSVNGTSGWTNLTGKVITAVSVSNGICKIGVTAEDVGTQPGPVSYYGFARIQVVIGVNAVLVGWVAHATVGRYKPETSVAVGQEIAAVVQTIGDLN